MQGPGKGSDSCAFFECVVIISKQSAHDLSSCAAGPLITTSFVNCKIEAKITGSRDLKLVAYVAFFLLCKLQINNNNKQAGCGLALSKDKSKKHFLEFWEREDTSVQLSNNNNKQAWCGLSLSKDKSKKRFLTFEKEKTPRNNSVITTSKHVTSFSWALGFCFQLYLSGAFKG